MVLWLAAAALPRCRGRAFAGAGAAAGGARDRRFSSSSGRGAGSRPAGAEQHVAFRLGSAGAGREPPIRPARRQRDGPFDGIPLIVVYEPSVYASVGCVAAGSLSMSGKPG